MIEFNEEKHEYKYDGVVVPSVTQVCRFLSVDSMGGDTFLRDQAAIRGSAIHEATMMIDYEEMPEEFPVEWQGYLDAYMQFLIDHKVEWEGIEHMVGCRSFCGTIDRHGKVNGQECILDIKTGSKINHALVKAQLGGYSLLLDPVTDYKIDKIYCLHLNKDATYELYDMGNPFYAEELFTDCLTLHRELKGFKGEKV